MSKCISGSKSDLLVIIILMIFTFIMGWIGGENLGWRKAYRAYQNNTLEILTQKNFPELWIKYNTDNTREQN